MAAKRITLNITILHNSLAVTATMDGYAYLDAGYLFGRLDDGERLNNAQRVLLTALTYTGCPIAARSVEEAPNPWSATLGSYEGFRTVSGPGFSTKSWINAVGSLDEIIMDLSVDVYGNLPDLINVSKPFQERIVQDSPGNLAGEFAISFDLASGESIDCEAYTAYKLAYDGEVVPVWRNITISAECSPNGMTQVEQIDLFSAGHAAKLDLIEKQSVGRSNKLKALG